MSSETIYQILSSKPHDEHYLKRYFKFVYACLESNSNKTKEELGYCENHHICPKADDLFPEYKSFKEHPWNSIKLTGRQHFIAHKILWKAYGGSQTRAFFLMSCELNIKDSNTFDLLRKEYSKLVSIDQSNRIKGTAIYKDVKTNILLRCSVDDPRISSGELVSPEKGKYTYKDKNGNLIRCLTTDPRVLSKELTSCNLGRVATDSAKKNIAIAKYGKFYYKDKTGKGFMLYPNDERIIEENLERSKNSKPKKHLPIYQFVNKITNEIFIGNKKEFKQNICPDKNTKLLFRNGCSYRTSCNGWQVLFCVLPENFINHQSQQTDHLEKAQLYL